MFSFYSSKLVRKISHNRFAMSADWLFLSGTFYGNWIQATAFQRSASTITKAYVLVSLAMAGAILFLVPDIAAKLKGIVTATAILYAAKTATLRVYLVRNAQR